MKKVIINILLYLYKKKKKIEKNIYYQYVLKSYAGRIFIGKNVNIESQLHFNFDKSNSSISIGDGTNFRGGEQLLAYENGKIVIGENVFFNYGISINSNSSGLVTIGRNSMFGESVKIYDHNHRFRKKDISFKDQGYKSGNVSIGENCWIGSNTIILRGAKIGNNVVVGANCIISEEIPDGTLVQNNSIISTQPILFE